MISSTRVTKEAMTSTNTGMRISGRTRLRTRETVPLEQTMTAVVARPMPSPLVAEVVVASSGQSPSRATSIWLLLQMPPLRMLP